MAITKRSYDRFEYILYEKKSKDDFNEFKEEIAGLERNFDKRKDIIIDLTKCDNLMSPEIGVLAKAASVAVNAGRYLRLAVSPALKVLLEKMSLAKLERVIFYDNIQSLLQQLSEEQKQGQAPAAKTQETEVIRLEGSLTGPKVKEMTESIKRALRGNAHTIVLEFGGVEKLDTICIGEIIQLDELAKNRQKKIVMANPGKEVMDMLQEASLDKVLQIISSPPPSAAPPQA